MFLIIMVPCVYAADVDVVWTDLVGVSASGNDLTKTAGNGWNNGGAASTDKHSGDFGLEFSTNTLSYNNTLCGLSSTNADADWDTIDYAIYFSNSATVEVYESGTLRGSFGSFSLSDVFKVERTGTTITYKKNGTTFYTSTISSTGDLLADTSFYYTNRSILDAKFTGVPAQAPGAINDLSSDFTTTTAILSWSAPSDGGSAITEYEVQYGTVTSGTFGSTYTDDASPGATITGLTTGTEYQFRVVAKNSIGTGPASNVVLVTPSALVDVVWTDLVGVTATGNTITQNVGGTWGVAGAASDSTQTGNFGVQFEATETNKHRMCGLSDVNVNANYTSIDYALYLTSSAGVQVYENGSYKGAFGTYQSGDIFAVERMGTSILYKKNGVTFYTSATPSSGALLVDAALNWNGSTITNAQFFGISTSAPDAVSDLIGISQGTSIDLDWSAPASNGSPITEYEVQYGLVSSGTFASTYTDDAVPGATVTGLTTGASYQFRIVAKNANGSGQASNILTITPRVPIDVVWTDFVGVGATGNDLAKTSMGGGWGAAGGASTSSFEGDFGIEFTANETTTYRLCGFSDVNVDANYTTIDYAIDLIPGGVVHVYEGGTDRGNLSTYQTGDKFQIVRNGSEISYHKNGVVFYRSSVPSAGVLLVDTAFYDYGATIQDAKFLGVVPTVPGAVNDLYVQADDSSASLYWSAPSNGGSVITGYDVEYGTVASGTFGSTYADDAVTGATITGLSNGTSYQFRVVTKNAIGSGGASNVVSAKPDINSDVVWRDIVGGVAYGNDLQKNIGAGWGNAGAISTGIFTGDFALDFEMTNIDKAYIVGLSDTNTNNSWETIDYGIYVTDNQTLEVYESGVSRGDFGPYQAGDKIKIERTGTTITYLKNEMVFYTSTVASSNSLFVDSSIYYFNHMVTDARIWGQAYPNDLITNVSHTDTSIDPGSGQTSTINFTLDRDADVTIKIYKGDVYISNGKYYRVYEDTLLLNSARTAGANTFVWNGKDSTNTDLDDSAYVYTIDAVDSTMNFTYDPEYVSGTATFSNMSVTPATFNPYQGETVTVSYDVSVPSWVILWVGRHGEHYMDRRLVEYLPSDTTGNTVIWDGRTDDGDMPVADDHTVLAWSKILPDNAIIVDNHPGLTTSTIQADPYVIYPVYGQSTEIEYTISESGNVTLTIVDTQDQTVATLVNNVFTNIGSHTVEWDGLNDLGKFVDTEGHYKIRLSVTKDSTTQVIDGNITVFE